MTHAKIRIQTVIRFDTPHIHRELALDPHHYNNGLPALCLTDPGTGEPWATASVNPPTDASIFAPGFICLKGWSENEGIPAALVEAGIVSEAVGSIPSGFVTITVHRINPEYLALWGIKEAP